jgi:hypothetical protein
MIHRCMTFLRFSARLTLHDLEKEVGNTAFIDPACGIGPAAAASMDFSGRGC